MKIRYILTLLPSVMYLFNSCTGLLDKYPHTSASPDAVSESDLAAMRTGMYNMVQHKPGAYSYIAFDIFGGDFLYSQSAEPINYINNQMTALSGVISGQWNGYYEALYQVNNLISTCERFQSSSEEAKTYLGEAYYFRALIYTELVTRWGKVPILRTNTMEKVPRDPVEDVWAFIEENIENAENLLGPSSSYYYVSDDALKALKARVFLYEGKNKEAADLAESLITCGRYSLDSFDNIFGADTNTETIFAFSNQSTENGIYLGSQFYTYNYVNKGGGWFYVSDDTYNAFENGDIRKTQGIYIETEDPSTIYHYCVHKYRGGQSFTDPIIISRIAEMYLVSAEAQGYPNGLARLNELRKERGLGDADVTADTFLDAVLNERRFEFLGENHRYYDLVRTGKALSTISGMQSYQLLFPVPDAQRTLNDLLDQNEGY